MDAYVPSIQRCSAIRIFDLKSLRRQPLKCEERKLNGEEGHLERQCQQRAHLTVNAIHKRTRTNLRLASSTPLSRT
jgi:hypothetical protein